MGFASFLTSDTEESVSNLYSERGAYPCKLLLPNGSIIVEKNYEGYARFEGVHIYIWTAIANGISLDDEAWENPLIMASIEELGGKMFYDEHSLKPKIVSMGCTAKYEELPNSEWCPNQGYFYD